MARSVLSGGNKSKGSGLLHHFGHRNRVKLDAREEDVQKLQTVPLNLTIG
jgi:hypothetical protein